MIDKYEIMQLQTELEKKLDWNKWAKEIPYITFPSDWQIQIIPPFNWAIIRFHVKYKNRSVSVYLDCYDFLGSFGEPYWEVCPVGDDVYRCKMNDVESLMKAIKQGLADDNL